VQVQNCAFIPSRKMPELVNLCIGWQS
jgi:hypothetical protein